MFELLAAIVGAAIGAFRSRAHLIAENLALRQQLAVLRRKRALPRLVPIDRAFWILLSRIWSRWSDALALVKPETVIAWHRRGFAQFWAWKSRRRGRPPTPPEIVALIVRMANDNPRWSRRRIANELAMLGYRVDKNTVAKYMPKPADRPRRPPSQTWGTFVRNHLPGTLAIDFFTVPTVRFEVLYVFVVLSLERRRILHVNVTAHPNAEWTAQQIVEAVGRDDAFTMLIRDRDGIYGAAFDRRVNHLGITQLRAAPRSPWQNGYVERLVGTFRRELVDHLIVLNELHLLRCVRAYARYYNEDRPHMSLEGDAPVRRLVEPADNGTVVALPRLGGLHHRCTRRAARTQTRFSPPQAAMRHRPSSMAAHARRRSRRSKRARARKNARSRALATAAAMETTWGFLASRLPTTGAAIQLPIAQGSDVRRAPTARQRMETSRAARSTSKRLVSLATTTSVKRSSSPMPVTAAELHIRRPYSPVSVRPTAPFQIAR